MSIPPPSPAPAHMPPPPINWNAVRSQVQHPGLGAEGQVQYLRLREGKYHLRAIQKPLKIIEWYGTKPPEEQIDVGWSQVEITTPRPRLYRFATREEVPKWAERPYERHYYQVIDREDAQVKVVSFPRTIQQSLLTYKVTEGNEIFDDAYGSDIILEVSGEGIQRRYVTMWSKSTPLTPQEMKHELISLHSLLLQRDGPDPTHEKIKVYVNKWKRMGMLADAWR